MAADEHICFFRGCDTIVQTEKYYCDRHDTILERRRATQSERNRKLAADRRRQRAGRAA
jgi:hypothetical protein